MVTVTENLKEWLVANHHCPSVVDDADEETLQNVFGRKTAQLLATGELSAKRYAELCGVEEMRTPAPEKLFGRGDDDDGHRIRVKDPSEKYSEKRYVAHHVKTGQPVHDGVYRRECVTMSEAASVRHGVFLKYLAQRAGIDCPLSESETDLFTEICTKQSWAGQYNGEYCESIRGGTKQLIDDAAPPGSGGISITPIEFDTDIVSFPLLTGELFPFIDLKPVPRGRRIEAGSLATPTMTWGGYDATAMPLFGTAAMVNPLNTTVFTVNGAVEVGRDFLSDSPAEVGSTLTGLVGERLMNELDRIVANGNGTTEPQGIFQAAGVGAVVTANGGAGPPTLADYVNLLFGIGKQYRRKELNVAIISNDTTYQRSRQIAIDTNAPTTDQRPALAPLTTINDYECLGWPHRVENNLANTVAACCAMKKYRLYRRLGLDVRWETAGEYLSRNNLALLVFRARFGGRLMDANACARWANGQA